MRAVGRCALLVVCGALLASCTIFDRYTFPEPEAAVTLEGPLYQGPNKADLDFTPDCGRNMTVYWGRVRNTGDLDVEDVVIVFDVYGTQGEFLGNFRNNVFNGSMGDDEKNPTPGTSLIINQSGTFNVCTDIPWGLAVRVEYHTEFTPVPGGL